MRVATSSSTRGLGGAGAWPLIARAQQPALPVIGYVAGGSAGTGTGVLSARFLAAFRKGLGDTGYVEGQNVTVEYHSLDGQYDRVPALMADLVRRRVAAIAVFGVSWMQRHIGFLVNRRASWTRSRPQSSLSYPR
jgi:hypothetical protein